MSNGGFLDGFEGGKDVVSEATSPEQPVVESTAMPVPEAPAPVFVSETPAEVPAMDQGYSFEDGETMTPGQADRLAIEQLKKDEFLENTAEQEVVTHAEDHSTSDDAGTATVVSESTAEQVETEMVKDEVYIEVEKILEDGLGPFVETMEPKAKDRFVKKGREVTTIIANMVRHMHVKTKDVFRLLKEWLLTIPGVNKFFLEQEVKIKTDRITELDRVRREDAAPKL